MSAPYRFRGLALAAAAALLSACGGSSPDGSADSSSDPSAGSSREASFTTAAPAARPSGSLPPEAPAKSGAKYFAVFLALAEDVNDPGLDAAKQKAKQIGYAGGTGDINCTAGAREALNIKPGASYTAYSIFFATAQQAQDFINGYPGKVVGTAYVTAGCLD